MKKINFKFKRIYYIYILLFIIVTICLVQVINWFIDNNKTANVVEQIEEYVEVILDENNNSIVNVDFDGLSEINSDIVGYVIVNNTNISYPVVKANDNNFYLNRSFDKSYNDAGWIFADYKNNFDGKDKNIILYGHSRLDESMFGSINDMLKANWYDNKENLVIDLITPNTSYKYEIFSMYYGTDEEYYISTEFTDETFSTFVNTLVGRSIVDFNIDPDKINNILTLSTCGATDDDRIVVHARLIN